MTGVTSDSTLWTADSVCVTSDGRIICIAADVVEPIHEAAPGSVTADSTRYTADSTLWTADGLAVGGAVSGATDSLDATVEVVGGVGVVEAANALDVLDATVEAGAGVGGGGGRYYPQQRPLPVYGVGYGLLPQLWGEAHGVVGVAGKSAAQVLVPHATAAGACGQAGNAAVVLKGLSVAGHGAIGTHGSGEGMIVKFSGSATGHHDDDEAAAVIAILLAA